MELPASPPPAPPPPLVRTRGLATAVVVLLAIGCVASTVSMVAGVSRIAALQAVVDGRTVTQHQMDATNLAWTLAYLLVALLLLGTGITWCVWQHRAQRNAIALGGGDTRFTPGWAVGWWFIPIASLWKPFQTVRELWKASHGPAWERLRTWRLLPWWWAAWLLAGFNLWIGGQSDTSTGGGSVQANTGDLRNLAVIALLSAGAMLVAGVLAIVIVRSVGRLQAAAELARTRAPSADAGGMAAPSVTDHVPRVERALIAVASAVVVVVAVGGLAWAEGDRYPAPSGDAAATFGDAVGITFDEHGVTFRYPVDWHSVPVSTTEVGRPPVWNEGFEPPNLQPVEIVIVGQYDIDTDTSQIPQEALRQQVSDLVHSLASQLSGTVTSDTTPIRFGSLEGFTTQLTGTVEGVRISIRFNVAFDGFTEYTIACQSTPDSATAIAQGCTMITDTFVVHTAA